jgi:hypothetical protein
LKHHLILVPLFFHGAKNNSITHEITIKLIGIETIIFGSILKPFVSSSKNLMRPPLDAGSGAAFLSAIMIEKNEF